jgi:hypothetical protein
MRFHLIAIRKDRQKAREKLRAEVPGGTKSRFHDALHAPASRRNSNTLIMASGWFATGLVEIWRNATFGQAGLILFLECDKTRGEPTTLFSRQHCSRSRL